MIGFSMSERGGGCFKGLLGDVKAPSTNDGVHPITGIFADQPYLENLLDRVYAIDVDRLGIRKS